MTLGYYLTQMDKLMDDEQYDARMTVFLLEGVRRAAMVDNSLKRTDRIRVFSRTDTIINAILATNPQIGYYITKDGEYTNENI